MKEHCILNSKIVSLPPKYQCLEEEEEGDSLDPVFFGRESQPNVLPRKKSPILRGLSFLALMLLISILGSLVLIIFKAQQSLDESISENEGIYEKIRGLIETKEGNGKVVKEGSSHCHLPKDPGPCRGLIKQFYFNQKTENCEEFFYGGCDGNLNRFMSKDNCLATCAGEEDKPPKKSGVTPNHPAGKGMIPEICRPKPKAGPCRSLMTRYYFDSEKLICSEFYYGGCSGNSNNFPSKEECEKQCEHPNPRIVQVDPPAEESKP
uniref:Tissue factor pathway inhibitor n=1 Tax=Caligus clemensi TaxID=344056 RepID=C1C0B3_CALCM|nr:Tissue factor pathway inhibitor precursor [Caligus clemensi]